MPKDADPIHLLCAADAHYGPYAGIMIGSVLRSNPGDVFHFHVFSDGMRRRDLRKLAALVGRAGSHCTIYDVSRQLAAYAKPAGYHLSRTTYARLLMADLMPAEIPRVLYLDCDIICTSLLRPLWETAERIPLLGAVIERAGDGLATHLELPDNARYFNAGVLAINLEAWREGDVGHRITDRLATSPTKLLLLEQDALNLVLAGAITVLPECWNLQLGVDSGPLDPGRLGGAVLLHYDGPVKPWRFRSGVLGAEIFLRHKWQSPWRFIPPTFRWTYRLRKSFDKRLKR
jgi:lipopolysaccharide biosynthesis glycosyltransferase